MATEIKSKICTICKIDKLGDLYSTNNGKLRSACKECSNRIKREKRQANAVIKTNKSKEKYETIKKSLEDPSEQKCLSCDTIKNLSEYEIQVDKLRKHCKECYILYDGKKTKPKSMVKEKSNEKSRLRYKNLSKEKRAALKKYHQQHYIDNIDTYKKNGKNYRKNNVEKEKVRHFIHFQENKEKIYEYRNEYYKNNPDKKFLLKLRQRLNKYYVSGNKIHSLVGCSKKFLQEWFQFNMDIDDNGMTLTNYGEYWHIDHIIPCDFYDFKEDENDKTLKLCFQWANLRPMKAEENLNKNNTVCQNYITEQNRRLSLFCKNKKIKLQQITISQLQDSSNAGTSLML